MFKAKRRGLTLVELMIAMVIATLLIGLMYYMVFDSTRLVARENAKLNLDMDADRALSAVTSNLRHALLPVKINNADGGDVTVGDNVLVEDIRSYVKNPPSNPLSFGRFMNNERVGFGREGAKWLAVLNAGTDFIPFAVPVPFIYDDGESSVTTLDSSMLPQLGIFTGLGSMPNNAVDYHVSAASVDDGVETRNRFLWGSDSESALDIDGVLSIHPYLQGLDPEYFSLEPGDQPAPPDLTSIRYQENLAMPSEMDQAFGIIRFVPLRDSAGAPTLIEERADFDLNGDGKTNDSYALGRIEMSLFPKRGDSGSAPRRLAVSTYTILLQLNTDSPSYKPLFRLRRQNSGGYAVDINLLMCDYLSQRSSPVAFNRSVPFIARQYSSSVELRNMMFN